MGEKLKTNNTNKAMNLKYWIKSREVYLFVLKSCFFLPFLFMNCVSFPPRQNMKVSVFPERFVGQPHKVPGPVHVRPGQQWISQQE